MGKVVTFYSYKGGTGRSMILANVAWALASNEQRVLIVDWDLEAPGLHRYLRPFLIDPELTAYDSQGLIDFVQNFAIQAATPPAGEARSPNWHEPFTNIAEWSIALRWPDGEPIRLGEGGEIRFVPAGRQGEGYAQRVNSFDWRLFYERLNGHAFFDMVRKNMKKEFDYVLIDSRTGVSDISGICTMHMPDVLVVCYTYNIQSIEGASDIARRVRAKRSDISIFPVAMRVEFQEEPLLESCRRYARQRFGEFVGNEERESYFNRMEVPYYTKYAYTERLAAFDDRPEAKGSISPEVSQIAGHLAGRQLPVVPPPEKWKEPVGLGFQRPPVEDLQIASVAEHVPLRPAVLVWAALVAVLAVGVAWSLWRVPSPASRRADVIAAAAQAALPDIQASLLLETAGLPRTNATKQLAHELLKRGFPSAVLGTSAAAGTLDPRGERVVTWSGATVEVWSSRNGRLLSMLSLTTPDVIKCHLLPNQNNVLVASADRLAMYRLPDRPQPQPQTNGPLWWKSYATNRLMDATSSKDGTQAAVLLWKDRTKELVVQVWQLGGRAEPIESREYILPVPNEWRGPYPPLTPVSLHASAKGFVVVGHNPLRVWRTGLQPQAFRKPVAEANLAYFYTVSTGGDLLAFSPGSEVKLMEIASRNIVQSVAITGSGPMTFSPDDTVLALQMPGKLELRSVANLNNVTRSFDFLSGSLLGIEFGLDGQLLYLSGPYLHLLYRLDRTDLNPDGPWPQFLRDLRASATVCLDSSSRTQFLLESKGEAQARFEACELSQGRPVVPHPSQEQPGTSGK